MTYIFITHSISSIGGAQFYIAAKAAWLSSSASAGCGRRSDAPHPWNVVILTVDDAGRILVPGLSRWPTLSFPWLGAPPAALTPAARHHLLDDMAARIRNIAPRTPHGDDIIIESTTPRLALWGELLARTLQARHLIYILNENISPLSDSEYPFFSFKLRRNELYGIVTATIPSMLPEADPEKTCLLAAGNAINPRADIPASLLPRLSNLDSDAAMTLITAGRFEKPYVSHLFEAIARFCRQNPQISLNFIIVGDAAAPRLRASLMKILDVPNLHTLHTGYLYPIPQKLFDISDLFIGASGCAIVALDAGVRTVTLDADDCMAIGFFGETTSNSVLRSPDEPPIPVETILAESLRDIELTRRRRPAPHPAPEPDFSPHARIISRMLANQPAWHDTSGIRHGDRRERLQIMVRHIGGMPLLSLLRRISALYRSISSLSF